MKTKIENERGGAFASAGDCLTAIEKLVLIAMLALAAVFLTPSALAQSSVGTGNTGPATYTSVLIPLPTNAIAAGAGTNFAGGWTAITSSTNITGSLYTNNLNGTGNPGFYISTNIVFYTNTTYARFFMPSQSRVSLEWVGTGSVNPVTNIFGLARSVTGRAPETTATTFWTNIVNQGVGTNTVGTITLTADNIGGDGWIYIVSETNMATSGILTNADGGVYAGSKPRIE
jgi:hypothetical protein